LFSGSKARLDHTSTNEPIRTRYRDCSIAHNQNSMAKIIRTSWLATTINRTKDKKHCLRTNSGRDCPNSISEKVLPPYISLACHNRVWRFVLPAKMGA
jgi:hypothetical protein